jgi:hypothetical protein
MFAKQLTEALEVLAQAGRTIDPATITGAVHINVEGHRRTTICHRGDFGRTAARTMVWWMPDGRTQVHII